MNWLRRLFHCGSEAEATDNTMKYLIVGLGNIGSEYEGTRHNAGFIMIDRVAKDLECDFALSRHAYRAEAKYKGRTLVLIKPTTYMNLSGKAVKYWMTTEKIPRENILVIVDDLALPVGTLRLKGKGGAGGHNGLTDIEMCLGTQDYARLRVGIGDNFSRGRQVDYVLSKFPDDDLATINEKADTACEIVKSFATIGIERTMNYFNTKK